jgi:hypothetical protein
MNAPSTLVRCFDGARPQIVCLCGSTRFCAEFRAQNLRLTLAGLIVLTIGCDTKSDGDLFGVTDVVDLKSRLDALHKRKIDLCDWVFVLDVHGYLGESTRSEIAYATRIGRPIRYLSAATERVLGGRSWNELPATAGEGVG